MDQKNYEDICRIGGQTKTLIDQMIEELEVGNQTKELYREFLYLVIYREKNAAALAMMEYLTNKPT
mgnify:CR=1 FL=1